MSVKKVNLKKTEAVEWELEIEDGSNKIQAKLAYTDDFDGWISRAPDLKSEHPDFPALKLKKISPAREEGNIVRVRLSYEGTDPGAQYPGRQPGVIKRYNMEPSANEEPLLTNALYKDLPDNEAEAIQELLNSDKSSEAFTKASGIATSSEGVKAIQKIRKGQDSYLNPGLVWVERFTTKNLNDLELGKLLKTTSAPPGPCPSAGSDRNWLYLAGPANANDDGESWDIERKWQLSEIGKWDPDHYPAGG